MRKIALIFNLFILLTFITSYSYAEAQQKEQPKINWKNGPLKVDMSNIAKLDLGKDYNFADKSDTQKIMKSIGNPPTNAEIGSVFPKSEKEDWFVIFEYFDIGHIKDSDKDKINADELLKSIKDGTEASNKERKSIDGSYLTVKGWLEKPNYNQELHSLVWGILAEESTKEMIVNYEARLLCREGYVSATLVCSNETFTKDKIHLKNIIQKFSFVNGKRYEDYIEGQDKLSDLGLAALIVGGTAAVAKKGFLLVIFAFLKKFGLVLFVPIIAFFKKIFGKKSSNSSTYDTMYNESQEQNSSSVNLSKDEDK